LLDSLLQEKKNSVLSRMSGRNSGVGVPLVPGLPRGLGSARLASLPPDGLLCNYTTHLCHGQRLQGYEFCIRHILEDKTAAYKPCAFTGEAAGGQVTKCPRAAPRTSRGEGFCREHSRAVVSARHRLRKRTRERGAGDRSTEALMESLNHYKVPRGEGVEGPRLGQIVLGGEASRGEDSDSEEGRRVGDYWGGDGESEAESVDSEGEDSLKHAGVYTGEEVMRTMRDKLIRLQKLYIEQFGRLQHKLRESRRGYLAQVREEKEAGMMNISSQPRETSQYLRLKALTHYHAPAGREALLAARHREKRAAVSGLRGSTTTSTSSTVAPCQHAMTSTTRCGAGVIPMSRFCPRHILEQPGQVLYRQCGVVTDLSDGPCETAVPAIFSHSTCVFHTQLLPIQSVGQDESRSEAATDIGSLVAEVLTAANNAENINNDASDEATAPNREFIKEELPTIKDEIDTEAGTELKSETGTNMLDSEGGENEIKCPIVKSEMSPSS